jgi:hypothetical protein
MIAPLLVAGLVVLGVAAAIAAGVAIAKLVAAGNDADQNFANRPVGSPTQPCPLSKPPVKPGDEERLVKCILELCDKDRDVVAKARKLDLVSRNPKKIVVHRFQGGKWTEREVTSLGSASGRKVWLNRNLACDDLKDTIYHEVVHTDQPADMPPPQKEMDAYIKTEQWLISRGLPGNPGFRKIRPDGTETVNEDAIKKHVQDSYGYNIPDGAPLPPQVTGRASDGHSVTLDDGTTRPAREGDAYKTVPSQDLQEARIPPDALQCP